MPEGIEKRLLIDGQQRLTTLLILLALVRDRAKKSGAENVAAKIQDLYLTNQHESGQDVYKLLPTQGEDIELSDRHNFVRVIRGEPPNPKTPIGMACHYFERAMSKEGAPPPEALHRILVNRLTLVSIILDDQDNPHRIFESLNGKGRPLSQADLIRNYFFMRIDESLHEQTYVELWRPMQERLGEEQLTAFVRHLLTSGSTIVRETDVYSALKAKVDGDKSRGPLEHLKDLVRASHFYEALLRPEKETRGAIRERLARLNRLEVTVAYPFLLGVYDDLALGKLTEADVCSVLDTVENFIVRRFVCAVPTYGLNKIFAPLYPQAAEKPVFAAAVQKILATKGYPRDAQFRERLESARLYGGGDRREKTKLLLERIEESFGHKEQVLLDALTIEHILAQTVTEAWKAELGPAWETDHEELLHTLGNLTLTNYNSELCNDSFNEKKELYAESHVELNKYFSTLSSWNAQAIERRAETLAEKALALWPYFGPEQEVETEAVTVTGRVPQTVTIRTQISPVRSWVDVAVATMEAIAQLGDGEFDRVVSEMPRFVNRDRGAFRKSSRLRTITNGAHVETNLSAQAIYRLVLVSWFSVNWSSGSLPILRRDLSSRLLPDLRAT